MIKGLKKKKHMFLKGVIKGAKISEKMDKVEDKIEDKMNNGKGCGEMGKKYSNLGKK